MRYGFLHWCVNWGMCAKYLQLCRPVISIVDLREIEKYLSLGLSTKSDGPAGNFETAWRSLLRNVTLSQRRIVGCMYVFMAPYFGTVSLIVC